MHRARTTGIWMIPILTISFLAILTASMAQEPDEGEQIYIKKCKMCHGAEGLGDTKAGQMTKTPDLNKHPWKHTTLQEVEKLLREGLGKMPKNKGKLTDEQIKAVAVYTMKRFEASSQE